MRVLLILFFVFGISQLIVFAQNSIEKTGCPVFSVAGPSTLNSYDEPVKFRLEIDRKLSSNTKIGWTVSAGKILSGQGTESITVENSKIGETVTATIELVGLPNDCENSFSTSAPTICFEPPLPVKADEFGKISNKILKEKIGDFSVILKKDPSATGIIFKYFPKHINKLNAYKELQTILNYLKFNGIDKERIIFQIGFEGNEKSELWVVPAGVASPLSEMFDKEPESLDAAELRRRIAELSKKQ